MDEKRGGQASLPRERDGRKCATSDLVSNNKEPIKVLTLATKGNETKQPIIESQSAKSEEKKLRVHNDRG